MNDHSRSISWIDSISDELSQNGPTAFSIVRLQNQEHLFAHRAALFYTPTENIPPHLVGAGTLDLRLPVPSPDFTEFFELRAYGIPRFWVDLIQRQSHKLRWQPMSPARVVFTRYDYFKIRPDHLTLGTKALLDALKVWTTGRRDGLYLHYFGAIEDDGPEFVDVEWHQKLVKHPRHAGLRIQVVSQSRASNTSVAEI